MELRPGTSSYKTSFGKVFSTGKGFREGLLEFLTTSLSWDLFRVTEIPPDGS